MKCKFPFFHYHMLRRLAPLLISLTFAILSASPAQARAKFRTLEVGAGISSNHINAVLKDSRGYMWFATASGLDRYDGYDITRFHSIPGDSTSLPFNYITAVAEDAAGNLWIHSGDAFATFNPASERFHTLNTADYRTMGSEGPPSALFITPEAIWLGAYGKGVIACATGENPRRVEDKSGLLSRHEISSIHHFPAASLIVAANTRGHIFIIDTRKMQVSRILDAFNPSLPLTATPDNGDARPSRTNSVYVDSEGWLWYYSIDGLQAYDLRQRRWVPDVEAIAPTRGIPVKAIAEDEEGKVWIGLDNGGVTVTDKRGLHESYTHNQRDNFSLGNNSVLSLYCDDDGGMWVGTYKGGVSVCNRSEVKFDTSMLDDVNCMLPAGDNSAWVGTDTGALLLLDLSSGKAANMASNPLPAIVCMAPAASGGIWIGTFQGGILRYRNGVFSRFSSAHGLGNDDIWALLENPDGTLTVGTLGAGIRIFDPASARVIRSFDTSSSLPSDYIISMIPLADGSLLLGTPAGMCALDPLSGEVTDYASPATPHHMKFASIAVNQLFEDSRGLIWAATREGLYAWDRASGAVYTVPLSTIPANPFVLGVAEDADGNMWASVDGRLINVDVAPDRSGKGYSFTPAIYDASDGIQSGTFNQRSFCRLPSGELLAGGVYGITHVVPENITRNLRAPRVFFTGLTIRNRPVRVGAEDEHGFVPLPQALADTKKLQLKHYHNDFSIFFATDNQVHPTQTRYLYRLVGFNDAWQELPKDLHWITCTSLPAGEYELQVRAFNNDGVESEAPASLLISVEPPFWASWWAKGIYLILILLAVYIGIRLVKRREQRRFARRRRRELAQKQEELNQLKFKFFTNISHELRTPLSLILAPVESMLRDNPDERSRRRLLTIRSNATNLLYLVNQLLDFRKNEMSGLTFHGAKANIAEITRSVCDSFSGMAERRAISFSCSSSAEEISGVVDPDKLTKTITNILSNAFKYTPDGGAISVEVRASEGMAEIAVADSGKGISDADKAHIFERFFRTADTDPNVAGSGIGLSLVYEYMRLHNGEVLVADNSPCGSVFTLRFPLQRPEFENVPHAPVPASVLPPHAPAEAAPANPEATAPPASPDTLPRVLVVDDNYSMLEFLMDEFRDEFHITPASDGVEALRVIAEAPQPFDLIVSDLMMPNMGGIELSRRLKESPATGTIPLLLLTAKQDVQSIVEGLTIGADDYVTKPFDNNVLRLKMLRLMELRRKGARRPLIEPHPSEVKITSLDEQLVAKAVKYVEENISRPDLSVEEMAAHMGMSRVHLYKKLRAITGKTPLEFIRVLRLKRAAQYLRESQMNVSEIAYNLGFNNPKYFTKYFKEEFGLTPSEYQSRQGI